MAYLMRFDADNKYINSNGVHKYEEMNANSITFICNITNTIKLNSKY